jgi:GNAT superfamily N-acetyltransferase
MTPAERIALECIQAFSDATYAGGAVVLRVPEAPDSPMLNRIVGLGVGRPATEDDLDEALAQFAPGVTFYVGVSPHAQPAQLTDWLSARGLEPGWGWMEFHRGLDDPPHAETSLRVVEAEGEGDAVAFARIVCESYGLPEAVQPRVAAAGDCGWQCWVAYDGDEPAAAAGLYVADRIGYLGFAGTLAAYRGRGAQAVLLARRIRRCQELGCELLVAQTGERRDDLPSNSYRNILRAGFHEGDVTANWRGRSRS